MLKEIARPAERNRLAVRRSRGSRREAARLSARRAARHRHPWPPDRCDPPRRAVKTLEEAASVDIQMMVGAGREERALSDPVVRGPQTLAVAADQSRDGFRRRGRGRPFRATIAQFTALAVLLPVVAGSRATPARRRSPSRCAAWRCAKSRRATGFACCSRRCDVGIINGLAIAPTTAARGRCFGAGARASRS